MRLVIFDIDGTLTQTMNAEAECFVRSLADVCGFTAVDTDWSRYTHVTDAGVFQEIYEARAGRSPTADDVSQFRQHFVCLLAQASSETPFMPVTGAPQLLSRLTGSVEHSVALATGAWRDSARLKMASAGLCYDDYPAASSDDAQDRETIVRLSMRRAAERFGRISDVVYVGDGVWDARACRSIGIPFIGVGIDARAGSLAAEGAVCVFPDFSDADSFWNRLHEIKDVETRAKHAVDASLAMKKRIRTDLQSAMQARSISEVRVLRSLLTAIDNAQAVRVGGAHIRYRVPPFGDRSTEVPRVPLTAEDLRKIIESELELRHSAAAELECCGKSDAASEARTEAAVLARYGTKT